MSTTPPAATSSRKLVLDDILDLRAYEKVRAEEKARVADIKRVRRVELGTDRKSTRLNSSHL